MGESVYCKGVVQTKYPFFGINTGSTAAILVVTVDLEAISRAPSVGVNPVYTCNLVSTHEFSLHENTHSHWSAYRWKYQDAAL